MKLVDVLRFFTHRVPQAVRYRSRRAFRRFMRTRDRRMRALAERLGVFDAQWYCNQYADIPFSGQDPFVHYMQSGWREGRKPAANFDSEDYALIQRDYIPRKQNPITHLLEVGIANPAVCRWLDSKSRTARFREAPSIHFQPGLCLIGYLRSEIGLGQAARNLGYACDARRLPISFRHVPLPGRENDAEFTTKCDFVPYRRANLLVTGLPSILDLQHEIGPGRINILYPFWELSQVPQTWLKVARQFDEIWVPSSFVAHSFPPDFPRPVRLVPQPVRTSRKWSQETCPRESLRFYTYLDFDSHSSRKNPTAAVRAFLAAFPIGQEDVQLVVKARGGHDSGMREWLAATASDDSRIRVIDKTLCRAQMDALMHECDVFISLHRSEGFGFGAAEALAAAKPVVSTDYGGTTDFITPDTGFPVAYDLIPLKRGDYPGWEGQVWAEPQLDATVEVLRSIYEHRSAAEAKGLRGQALLRDRNSPAVVGARVRELLLDLGCLDASLGSSGDI